MVTILDETFSDGLNRYDGMRGLWSTETLRGRLMTNAEETVFIDPDLASNPWLSVPPTMQVTRDGLSIRTLKLQEDALSPIKDHMQRYGQGRFADQVRYATGRITTAETWAQTYGWFEIEAQIPRGKGRWPAFWLNFAGPGWPPEIDVFEAYGEGIAAPTPKDGRFNTAVLFDNLNAEKKPVHDVNIENPYDSADNRKPSGKQRGGRTIYQFTKHNFEEPLGADIYGRVNTYAALWTPTDIIFYFGPDRASLREIYRTPTPDDVNDPMYIIANDQFTARGGIWPADAALEAVLDPENDFLIRSISIKAFVPELAMEMEQGDNVFDDRSSVISDTPSDDIIAPGDGFDLIRLSGGSDEIRVERGRESKVIEGFGPDDTLVLEGFSFADSVDAHGRLTQVGEDVWLSSGADPFWPQSIILKDVSVDAITRAQIVSRWPVERNVWGTRGDLENRSTTDDDKDGVLRADERGGWLSDKGGQKRLFGGQGPERYMVTHEGTRIVEPEGGDVDAMFVWGSRYLPAHVERGILRGEHGRLQGTKGSDRLEAEGRSGQLAGGPGDDLYIISESASNITIRIEDTPGHDKLRGYTPSHNLLLAPSLLANRANWQWVKLDEGMHIVFNDRQSLLIEGRDLEARGLTFQSQ